MSESVILCTSRWSILKIESSDNLHGFSFYPIRYVNVIQKLGIEINDRIHYQGQYYLQYVIFISRSPNCLRFFRFSARNTTNNGNEKECTFFSCEIIFYIRVIDTWANFSFINNYEKKNKCALKCIKSHQMHLIRPTFGSQRIKLKIDPFGFVAHINCLILYVEENIMWRIND